MWQAVIHYLSANCCSTGPVCCSEEAGCQALLSSCIYKYDREKKKKKKALFIFLKPSNLICPSPKKGIWKEAVGLQLPGLECRLCSWTGSGEMLPVLPASSSFINPHTYMCMGETGAVSTKTKSDFWMLSIFPFPPLSTSSLKWICSSKVKNLHPSAALKSLQTRWLKDAFDISLALAWHHCLQGGKK